ncbi:MAG: glycoside hydrolase family 31 protein [Ruminococcaceae bacterium]|nr:glycoside hydrolase family 31 protein [Oscillospiraceae bacterium]
MSKYFTLEKGVLNFRRGHEIIRIEGWGKDALRVRTTENKKFTEENWALSEEVENNAEAYLTEEGAAIKNGKIRAELTNFGRIRFLNEKDEVLLTEYYRTMNYGADFGKDMDLFINMYQAARTYRPVGGDNFKVTLQFAADDNEKIFGMGQYQQDNLNLKGSVLDLKQLNTQASVPFYVSNKGYGFYMNNPGIGKATFATNHTEWVFESTKQLDYYITAGDSLKEIEKNYTAVTGRAPEMPEYAMGFWQCKLRYQTQEELLNIARGYYERKIPVDIIVVDFFHWTKMGEWKFDPEFWPDPEAMVKELESMGIKLVVSVWPTVDKDSENMPYMRDNDLLIRTKSGLSYQMDCVSPAEFADMTNPETREYVFDIIKNNYLTKGVSQFWLDVAEPEYGAPNHENYRYYKGDGLEVANAFPMEYVKMFYEGMHKVGRSDVISLVRCAWAGSQKYGALAWSGDVRSTFRTFKRQVKAGLNIGLAGIPWWNADIGGFMGGNIETDEFKELLMRWFAFGAFSPVMRLHGDRDPHTKKPLVSSDGKPCAGSGADNEVWSYGENVEKVLRKFIDIRYKLKPYIKEISEEASLNGSPMMRTLFYEFENDKKAWDIEDEYMLGGDLLVAPVFEAGVTERKVYLPAGETWVEIATGIKYEGGAYVKTKADIDVIPVFARENSKVLDLLK